MLLFCHIYIIGNYFICRYAWVGIFASSFTSWFSTGDILVQSPNPHGGFLPMRLARDYERVLEVAGYYFSSGKAGYVHCFPTE